MSPTHLIERERVQAKIDKVIVQLIKLKIGEGRKSQRPETMTTNLFTVDYIIKILESLERSIEHLPSQDVK